MILILPAGTGAPGCDLTIEMFKRSFSSMGVELIKSVTSEAYSMGDSNNDQIAKKKLRIWQWNLVIFNYPLSLILIY